MFASVPYANSIIMPRQACMNCCGGSFTNQSSFLQSNSTTASHSLTTNRTFNTTNSSAQQLSMASLSSSCSLGEKKRYKTEMCRRYQRNDNNYCEYGEKCQYAHGMEDLRMASYHMKYKTIICRAFHYTGVCPYGRRCDFIHSESAEKLQEIRSYVLLYHQFRQLFPHLPEMSIAAMKQIIDTVSANGGANLSELEINFSKSACS